METVNHCEIRILCGNLRPLEQSKCKFFKLGKDGSCVYNSFDYCDSEFATFDSVGDLIKDINDDLILRINSKLGKR